MIILEPVVHHGAIQHAAELGVELICGGVAHLKCRV